jgi:hypothetical protein
MEPLVQSWVTSYEISDGGTDIGEGFGLTPLILIPAPPLVVLDGSNLRQHIIISAVLCDSASDLELDWLMSKAVVCILTLFVKSSTLDQNYLNTFF